MSVVLEAVNRFLALVEREETPSEAELRRVLDELALATHSPSPNDERLAAFGEPRSTVGEVRARVVARFPQLGLYNEALEIVDSVGTSGLGVGDAIDDLADITSELEQVRALAQDVGEPAALWQFDFGFRTHWGRHLRSVQLYLHVRSVG